MIVDEQERPFGEEEEEVILALAFDMPEFYASIGKYITYTYFRKFETQVVAATIEKYFTKFGVIPTRKLVKDQILKQLTADDDYKPVVKLLERKVTPREVPIIKDVILSWAKHKAFGLIYSDEALSAYDRHDYDKLEEIIENARRISDINQSGLAFFSNLAVLFDEDTEERLTCGFSKLDQWINLGGPTRKELFIWMGPTGHGKSLLLVTSAVACIQRGLKVLHITLEMSNVKTGLRYLGAISGVQIKERKLKRAEVEEKINKFATTYGGDLKIFEYPPEEISTDNICQLIDQLNKVDNWMPDIIVIDYLELMLSKNKSDNKEDYTRQKKIAAQIRGMAKNFNVLIFTATQTNREEAKVGKNSGSTTIGMNRVAESYGKLMAADYVVSINQSPEEAKSTPPRYRFTIVKNRNGPKNQTITATVDYGNMTVKQEEIHRIR